MKRAEKSIPRFSGTLWKTKIFFKAFWKHIITGILILLFFLWTLVSIVHSISSINRQDVIDGSARAVVKTEKFFEDLKTKVDELRKEKNDADKNYGK